MEKFLREQVEMVAEVRDIELTKKDIIDIVEDLMNNDELWDTFDSFIHDALDSYED